MQLIKMGQLPKEPFTNSSAGLIGGPVTVQHVISPKLCKYFRINVVNFSKGARNKFHVHSRDQVLMVTVGTGIVATEKEKLVVGVGDVIFIPEGEKHWHGATENSEFSHIYVAAADMSTKPVKD